MRIVILGAGFGGLELATLLSEEFGQSADVVLIDKAEGFVFGFSKLDVMFGRATEASVLHRYVDVVKPGVRFVRSEILTLDPVAKRVTTASGTFDADLLVVAWAPISTRQPLQDSWKAGTSSTRSLGPSPPDRPWRTSPAATLSSG